MQGGHSLTSFCLVLANSDDDIGRILGSSIQIVIDNLPGPTGVSGLGVEGSAGVVRYHSVTTAQWILHGSPGVITGSRLDIPDIPGVSVELTTLYSLSDCPFVADRATSGVHQPRTLLEMAEQLGVDQPTGGLVKWSVDSDNVAFGDEFLEGVGERLYGGFASAVRITLRSRMRFAPTASAASTISKDQLGVSCPNASDLAIWERGVVVVQKLLATERLETLQDPVSNPTSTDGTDNFALEVKGVPGDVSDVPVATLDHLMSGHEVPDEQED